MTGFGSFWLVSAGFGSFRVLVRTFNVVGIQVKIWTWISKVHLNLHCTFKKVCGIVKARLSNSGKQHILCNNSYITNIFGTLLLMIQRNFSLPKNVGESSSNILALANVFLFLQISKEFQPNNKNYFENFIFHQY